MTGTDQEFLVETGQAMLPAARTSALLARCVEQIGMQPVSGQTAGQLVVGDREALLLHLRRISFGEQLEPFVRCPRDECAQNMDISLRVSNLLIEPSSPEVPQTVERQVHGKNIRFRLPCGEDQEAVAELARTDAGAAARELLTRCLGASADAADSGEVSAGTISAVGDWMTELDPQAEIRLNLTCPECGHAFTSLFDAGAYLFEETALHARELYREVHLLAFHYHWSEAEIMGMAPPKRKRYLNLLLEALG